MDFIDHRSTANFIFGLSATDEKVRITSDGDVGIGVSNPSTKLEVDGTVTADDVSLSTKAVIGGATPRIELFESDTTDVNTRFRNTGGTLQIQSTDDAGTTSKTRIVIDHATGDISFREDTGSTAKFYWDASTERLGIGNSSPTTALDVTGTVTADGLTVDGDAKITSAAPKLTFIESDTTDLNTRLRIAGGSFQYHTANDAEDTFTRRLQIDNSTGDVSLYEDTGATAKFYWDASAESLGINTTSPSRNLHINDTMRLEPRASAPSSPSAGDIYFDSTLSKLRCYDGTAWNNLF